MKISGIPALSDNYIWVIEPSETTSPASQLRPAWIVDCGEAQPVIDYFQTHGLQLQGILLTHHHFDHVNGIAKVLKSLGSVPIYSNARGPYQGVTHHVDDGDTVTVLGEAFQVLSIPGHTHEHLAFYHPEALFSGDVLFTAGCGRTWTQSPKPMAESLLKLRQLNEDCWVYCGHDYTLANMNFAAIAEPENSDIQARRKKVHKAVRQGHLTLPERLEVEKATNPFLRFDKDGLKQTLMSKQQHFYDFALDSNANLYATLRAWKDRLDRTGELELI